MDCVGNITSGYFPDLLIKTHQEYQRGYIASNGSYNLCPIGENNAFCTGWYNNLGERAGECGDNPNNGISLPFRMSIGYHDFRSNDKTSRHDWNLGLCQRDNIRKNSI